MTEPPKDPVNREVLEKIAALEGENGRLSERVASLERRADSSHKFFMTLARQVNGVLHDVGLIELQIIELAEKVFPGYVRTQRQIMEILTPTNKAEKDHSD